MNAATEHVVGIGPVFLKVKALKETIERLRVQPTAERLGQAFGAVESAWAAMNELYADRQGRGISARGEAYLRELADKILAFENETYSYREIIP